jgi:hypothetical protein
MLKILESCYTKIYNRANRHEHLDVEPKDEVDTGQKVPYALHREL